LDEKIFTCLLGFIRGNMIEHDFFRTLFFSGLSLRELRMI